MKNCVNMAVAGLLLVCCKEVLAQENQDYVFLIPVLFQYGDCHNPNMLQELLLHLATQSLNTSQSYKLEYYTRNNFLGFGGSFHSPHTAMLISLFTPPGDYQIPEQYCRYYNITGIVVRIKESPDIAGVAIFRAAHYIQELPIYPHKADIADETLDSYEYYLSYGENEPGEIDAFVISSYYSNTTVTVETTEDLLLVRNGGPPSSIVLHSNRDREFTLALSVNVHTEVLWLEVATEDYDSRGERLIGTHITSNKPLKVYTAKAEYTRPLQFSFAARVLHVMPPSQMWGKTYIGDITAFQNLNGHSITLHFLCATNSALVIKWHQGNSNQTTADTVMLQSGIYNRISKTQSNITHFTIHSEHPVLVLYEVHGYNHLTGTVEQFSSVLLQPVEWFSSVQSVYQYLPTQPEQVQHISLTVNREHFDPSAIQLVAKYDGNGSYAIHRLRDYEDSYTLYEVEGYYLLYLNLTSIGHQQTLHSIRHINNSCAKMGATVYSYGHSNNSRVSYSNGYYVDKSNLSSIKTKHPSPTTTYSYSSSHHDSSEAPRTTYPYSSSHHDSSEALTASYSSSHHETPTSTLPTTTAKLFDAPKLALLPSSSASNQHDIPPTNSPPRPNTMPVLITPQHDPKTSSRIDRLATGMGAMSGGLFVLLVLMLLVSVGCWWRRRKRQERTSYHMHDMFPIARYSRLEEPPEAGYDFDIFLSFADEDREFVESNIYSPLRNKGYSVFWHHEDFVPGLSIGENICNAIDRSRRIIFVCTEDFAKSNFCTMELRYSLVKQHSEGMRYIIPIVFGEEHCPRELQGLNQVRLSSRHEDLEEEEIETIINRLALGDPLEPDEWPTETVQWIHDVNM